MKDLVELFEALFTSSFMVSGDRETEITKFDPRSNFAIRGELENISNELNKTKMTVSMLQAEAVGKKSLEQKFSKIKSIRDMTAALEKTNFGNIEIQSFTRWIKELDQVLNANLQTDQKRES